MMTYQIPTSVDVSDSGTQDFNGTYATTSPTSAKSYTWYPAHGKEDGWPHVTVMKDGNDKSGVNRLHVSIPIGGINVQLWYNVFYNAKLSLWRATFTNSVYHGPNKDEAKEHTDDAKVVYRDFAEAFLDCAYRIYSKDKEK